MSEFRQTAFCHNNELIIRTNRFPYKIGYDCFGVVTDTGIAVTRVHIGDEVYARLPEVSRGNKGACLRSLPYPKRYRCLMLLCLHRCLERVCQMRRVLCRSQAQVTILRGRGVVTVGCCYGPTSTPEVQGVVRREDCVHPGGV